LFDGSDHRLPVAVSLLRQPLTACGFAQQNISFTLHGSYSVIHSIFQQLSACCSRVYWYHQTESESVLKEIYD